jgi:hypothetical protein
MIICSHNIPRKDCRECMRKYHRDIARAHQLGLKSHGVPVWRELLVKPWRTI